jgi:hypothetical protein
MAMKRALVLAAALAVAACGGGRGSGGELTTAPCPRIGILADAADLTRFRPGGGRDLSAMVVDARLVGVSGRCDFARRGGALDVTVTVTLTAERGPAAEARSFDLPWFVAVTDADDREILTKREFTTRVAFGPNVTRTRAEAEPVGLTLPVTETRRVGDYAVRIGFQLTPEELALNRRRGPR